MGDKPSREIYDPVLSTAEAAAYLAVDPWTLHGWRPRQIGPAYVAYPSGKIGYRLSALNRFLEKYTKQEGRLPRPHAGRMPGGKNRPGSKKPGRKPKTLTEP